MQRTIVDLQWFAQHRFSVSLGVKESMADNSPETRVKPGEFPFPILDGPNETRYLTWVRNHSNYMAVRGFLDYVRAIGVLVRGMVINMLTLLPCVLLVALAVAAYRVLPESPPSFPLTGFVLAISLIWILLLPALTPIFKIRQHKKSIATGSDSSVRLRDRYERSFGASLILIFSVAVFELLAYILPAFNSFLATESGWSSFGSIAAIAIAVLSGADKLLSAFGGAARKVAMIVVGSLGVLLPVIAVLLVANFLVFSEPPDNATMEWVLQAKVVLFVGIGLNCGYGVAKGVFGGKAILMSLGLLAASWALTGVMATGTEALYELEYGILESSIPLVGEKLSDEQFKDERKKLIETLAFPDDSLLVEAAEYLKTTEVRNALQGVDFESTGSLEADPKNLANWLIPDSVEKLVSVDELLAQWYTAEQPLYGLGARLSGWRLQARSDLVYAASLSTDCCPGLYATSAARDLHRVAFMMKAIYVLMLFVLVLFFCWLTVDVNLTSIHGLYRDRLASAFLVGEDTGGTVAIEEDLDLAEICCHEAGSTAPYHIVNTALNLQGSKLPEVQDRQSDFFVFTKKFIGGKTTGYCRSETMERVFPQMDLPTAMAISAAAASPNMGRGTNPALVAIMTLLNVRLGFWIPNPGRIESWLDKRVKDPPERQGKNSGYSFNEVFREELNEIERRWEQLPARGQRCLASINGNSNSETRLAHGLVGVAYSGGGIRSATLNLGVTQALHQSGVFDHADYMSTVSGGGYLGSSISTLMRQKTTITSDVAGIVGVHESKSETMVSISEGRAYRFRGDARLRVIEGETVRAGQRLIRRSFSPMALVRGLFALYINPVGALWRYWKYKTSSEIDGTVSIKKSGSETVVSVSKPNNLLRTYFYASHAQLAVEDGDAVKVGQRLIRIGRPVNSNRSTLVQAYGWRVRPAALLREIRGKLDEKWRWVNVSDGGHIENLATIELLRRRCKYIIIGDGEADPKHHFNGLATLIRSARIDLGIHIENQSRLSRAE